ncbi:MAG: Putative oxidoreductase [uncultured Chloroflexi bacterium]|uniref:Oxidoreductase n=1 Tax=uncultured Chloroflexota bacterium TaxID=166587 RepID=A0A6J4IJ58_9CHLR|nr:MAG: Putative oxidoreductase [uncultured Chloroflexota bacterium]
MGSTGAKVSPICLGAMMFGDPASPEESHRILDYAREGGINFVDTANVYTKQRSEEIVGDWFDLGGGRRNETFLATKVHGRVAPGPNGAGNHRYHVNRQVEHSLRRLKTDRIDLYYFHRPEPETPIAEQVGIMQDLVRQGKIVYYGTSHYPSWMILQGMWDAQKLTGPAWVADQPRYSLVDRSIEQDVVPFAQANGYGLVPHSPLAGGFLTGKYERGGTVPNDSRAARRADWLAAMTDQHWALESRLREVAQAAGCTPGQAAIAWVLTRPFVNATIIGPRTLDQLQDNLGALDVTLPADAIQALTDASEFAAKLPRT